MLDHGPGATHRLLEAGRSITDVTHAFFSHLHYDHVMDYPRLLLQRWDQGAGSIDELQVYGPSPIARMTEQIIGDDGLYRPDINARICHPASQSVFQSRGGQLPRPGPAPSVTELVSGQVIDGKSWRMKVGTARHFQPYLECLAYRFECDAGTVVYSGDSGGVLESMIDLAHECDVLIHMCHFASGTEPSKEFRLTNGSHMDVAEIARKSNAKSVVLTHIVPALDEPGVLEHMVCEMSSIYDGNIIIGRDLMEVPLHPRLPVSIE